MSNLDIIMYHNYLIMIRSNKVEILDFEYVQGMTQAGFFWDINDVLINYSER